MFKISELSFGYYQNSHRFSDSIDPGTLTFVIGANGSGKTSLLKTLSGLLSPLSGRIEFSGKIPPLYLPAHPEVSDWLTAGDVFEIFCGNGQKPDQRELKQLGIEKILSSPIHHLSLGEQKRIFLAAALATAAETILLDEPLNSLDWNMEIVLKEVLEQHAQRGRTFIIAAHQLQWITRFKAATSWFLHDFSRLKSGPTESVLLSKEVQSVFNFSVAFTDNPLDGSRLIATGQTKRQP